MSTRRWLRRWWRQEWGCTALVLCSALPSCHRESLFGTERGLDHVGIAVKDLGAAQEMLHRKLGFGAFEGGKLPNGIENVNYYFEDSTYLETMVAWDPAKARWLAEQPQGAAFFALSVESCKQTAAFLSRRGFTTAEAIEGTIETNSGEPKPHWQTMFFAAPPLPLSVNALFFISYDRAARTSFLRQLDELVQSGKVYKHPNTAVGIKAVWLGLPDVAAAAKTLADMGFRNTSPFVEPRLSATGQAIDAGQGKILLVERPSPGILGLSIQVMRLGAVERLMAREMEQPVPPAQGVLGQSIFVAVEGTWIEFFEKTPRGK